MSNDEGRLVGLRYRRRHFLRPASQCFMGVARIKGRRPTK